MPDQRFTGPASRRPTDQMLAARGSSYEAPAIGGTADQGPAAGVSAGKAPPDEIEPLPVSSLLRAPNRGCCLGFRDAMYRVYCCDVCCFLALAVLLLCCIWSFNISVVESHNTEEAAERMFDVTSKDLDDELPEVMRGVFWMAGNTFPELLVAFQAGSWDSEERRMRLRFGVPYSWSYDSGSAGWLEFIFVQLSWSLGASYLDFECNPNYTYAILPFRVLGMTIDTWSLKQETSDGNTWTRRYVNADGIESIEYTIKRVIAADGDKLPAFYEMVHTTKSGVEVQDIPGIHYMNNSMSSRKKTYVQLVAGTPGAGSIVLGIVLCMFYIGCCTVCLRRTKVYKKCVARDRRLHPEVTQ